MRKNFALAMIAMLSLTIALAAVGCGQKKEETTETTPPVETSTMTDTTTMMSDTSMMADTSMHH
jgi:hypothetical protein